jgi:hypothetical protein
VPRGQLSTEVQEFRQESVGMASQASRWSLKWSYEGLSKGVTFGESLGKTGADSKTTLRPR